MRDFTWNYFSNTGDVNAYLFFKEISGGEVLEDHEEEEAEADGFDSIT